MTPYRDEKPRLQAARKPARMRRVRRQLVLWWYGRVVWWRRAQGSRLWSLVDAGSPMGLDSGRNVVALFAFTGVTMALTW